MPDSRQHVSLAEIERTAGDALRMLGLSVGHADDAAPVFVWTQATLGRGYDCIRLAETLRPTEGWPPPVATHSAAPSIALHGAPLLFYANRIADYIQALGSPCQVTIAQTTGGWAAGFIAHRLAMVGMGCVLRWLPAREAARGEAPAMVMASTPGKAEIGVAGLPGALVPPAGLLPASATDRSAADAARIDLGFMASQAALSIVAGPGDGLSPVSLALACARGLAGGAAEAFSLSPERQFRTATCEGLQIYSADHRLLGELVKRRWLPTSERSQQQAG